MISLEEQGIQAKKASRIMMSIDSKLKDQALEKMAVALEKESKRILRANQIDVKAAIDKGQSNTLIDRLTLNEDRLKKMAEELRAIAVLPDPIGEIISMWTRPNGLQIGQKRVPLGVIGIIYEARPNVTVDAAGLCIKAGNVVILRGGSEAIHSNIEIITVISEAAERAGLPRGAIQLVEDTSRESAVKLMKMNDCIDVLIPRGGAGLIRSVIENSTVPVIETGVGNCHIYVNSQSDFDMAEKIIINAKTSRPGVCNAAETLLVDEKIAHQFLPHCLNKLHELGVEIRGCEKTKEILDNVKLANEKDWYAEYLDYILAVRIVDDINQAIEHITKYGTKHSESIVTNDYFAAQKFLQEVDAAAVYVNASTRFTDGFEFGFGAEIGISTQKLHARGPMGLKELTTIKYIIYGNGQTR